MRDPALLEYAGRDAFKVRIFPIEPNSHKPIKLQYTQLLKTDAGLTEYVYPLNTEKFSARPLKDVSVKVTVDCKDPLKSIYCPSHNVEIKRDGDRRAVVGFEVARTSGPTPTSSSSSPRAHKPVGLDLLTYRNGAGDDGYFMLLASPGMDAARRGDAEEGHLLRHRHQRIDERERRQEDRAGEERRCPSACRT